MVTFQFILHFSQVIPWRDIGLSGLVGVNDRVRVKVEYLMLKKVKVLIQFELGVTGSESCHEDADSTVVRLVFF